MHVAAPLCAPASVTLAAVSHVPLSVNSVSPEAYGLTLGEVMTTAAGATLSRTQVSVTAPERMEVLGFCCLIA